MKIFVKARYVLLLSLIACSSRTIDTEGESEILKPLSGLELKFNTEENDSRAPAAEGEVKILAALKTRPAFDPNRSDFQYHVDHSLRVFEWRYGTSEERLRIFQHNFITQKRKPSEGVDSENCVSQLANSLSARNAFVTCLIAKGGAGLNTRLYARLFQRKQQLLKSGARDLETQQSAALINYVEDVIRQNQIDHGLPGDWFEMIPGTKPRFLQGKHHEYRFQDGDLLLSLGDSSISSLIPSSTWPGRRFSHAFIVHMPDGIFRTVEAIIEKGVVSHDLAGLAAAKKASLMVARWTGSNPKEVAARSSRAAFEKVGSDYNMSMDWSDTTKFFCNQLIAYAFAKGSGIPDSKLIPSSTKIVSDRLLAYLANLGVRKQEMPSPGDFLDSTYFENVAEFRDTSDLYRQWEMLSLGDIFVERVNAGFNVKPSLLMKGATSLLGTLSGVLDVAELGSIPDGLNGRSVAYMKTQEGAVFKKAWGAADGYRTASPEFNQRNLRSVPPWILRARLSYAIQMETTKSFSR